MDMDSFLMHYGIPHQKKGVRRFQNPDGSLTEEGKRRYGVGDGREGNGAKDETSEKVKRAESSQSYERKKADVKKILGVTAGLTLAALAAYGVYKGSGKLKQIMATQANNKANTSFKAWFTADENKRKLADEARLDRVAWKAGGSKRLSKYSSSITGRDTWYREDPRAAQESMLRNMRYASRYSKAATNLKAKEIHYRNIADSATRTKAVKNWVKNLGHINVDRL